MGDIVIVHDDVLRLKWQLAVVTDLQRGQDDAVRSAVIRTSNGVTTRPIVKLYPLEVNVEMNIPETDSSIVLDAKEDSSLITCKKPPSRPPRSAASKARSHISDWTQILRGPEDVTDDVTD